MSDSQSKGLEFDPAISLLGNDAGQVTHKRASVTTTQFNLVLARREYDLGEKTGGLAESNGSLMPGHKSENSSRPQLS